MRKPFAAFLAFGLGVAPAPEGLAQGRASLRVVINEILYHPPGDRDDLQFVEIHNPGAARVDISGWSFTQGIKVVFPAGTLLGAGSFGVVCRDTNAFRRHFGAKPALIGTFKGRLSHSEERVELADATGLVVDSVHYQDHSPWPEGADGLASSLERICPGGPSEAPWNWEASELPRTRTTAGTPGTTNTCFSGVQPPRLEDVAASPAYPGLPLIIRARVIDPAGVRSVTVIWCSASSARATNGAEQAAQRISGDARDGVYSATIPGQPADRIIRFTLRAAGTTGVETFSPGRNEPRPTHTASTFTNTNPGTIAAIHVLNFGKMQSPSAPRYGRGRPQPQGATEPSRGMAAVVYQPPNRGDPQVFDHVRVRQRHGGIKISFHKDRPLLAMSGINLLFESSPRYVLAEHLGYQLFRKAGVTAPYSDHARLVIDGRVAGYHLLVEQPNKQFLRRNGRDEEGNLYKILWYEQGVVGQHEKKSNPMNGHTDIVDLINQLNRLSGPAQWRLIEQRFNVEAMASYYAVNMCIQNWDGFFNNHYVYHDLKPGGKWEVFPWDLDKTWGDYDGAPSRYEWYTMPLTTGMNGDRPVGGGGFDFSGWWRPAGWFSGPLLANPEFRRRFITRLRQVCAEIFTTDRMEPIISGLENRLEPEIRARCQLTGEKPDQAVKRFKEDVQSFRNQVVRRRAFILKQLEG